MEDETGLDLSLGLTYGGSSSKSTSIDVPPDSKMEEGENSRVIDSNINVSDLPVKNFFEMSENQKFHGKEKTEQLSCQREGFLDVVGNHSTPATDTSNDVNDGSSQCTRYQDLRISMNTKSVREEDKSGTEKRKLQFEDINFQKKLVKTDEDIDIHVGKPTGATSVRNSRVSATTEDGSFGENEDVAESRCSDPSKYTDKHVLPDPDGLRSQGPEVPLSGDESILEPGKVAYGLPVSFQPVSVSTVPYPVPVKVSTATSVPNGAGFPSQPVMQRMPPTHEEHPVVQPTNSNNLPLAFGYATVQLPTLETNSPWAISSQPPQATYFVNRDTTGGAPKPEQSENEAKIPQGSPQVPHSSPASENNSTNLVKSSGTHFVEVGTSTQTTNDGNQYTCIFRQKEVTNRPTVEGFPPEGLVIRPGIAANVKFGGCGSYPDLPWVSTTGPGPDGKTISGVTYKYNKNQIKIVCACHGSHMSPEEFIQHAKADAPNPEIISV